MANEVVYSFLACPNNSTYRNFALGGAISTDRQVRGMAGGDNAALQSTIDSMYSGTALQGLVTAVGGRSWQKFVCDKKGMMTATIRGGAGGLSTKSAVTINATTGVVSDGKSRPGRGAKLVGSFMVNVGDVLYISVGYRGSVSNMSGSWGGGGGGATTILRVNPNGKYTFEPTNEKVDCLMVAGGGGCATCYIQSGFTSNHYPGWDASPENGSHTLGGVLVADGSGNTSNYGSPGAGLTASPLVGNSGTANASKAPYSILSGNWQNGAGSNGARNCWGGGGASQVAGGGGGGYSGGDTTSRSGGYGGTSFMNPDYVTSIYRGYATLAEDSNRDLTNPWTAYGNVELIFSPKSGFFLIEDSEGIKYFNGEKDNEGNVNPNPTNQWELLPEGVTLDEVCYRSYGNYSATNIDGLLLEKVKVLCMSEDPDAEVTIDGKVNKSIIQQKDDMIVSDYALITKLEASFDPNIASVKFAISKNSGKTWQSFDGTSFIDLDISDRNVFDAGGYDLSLFNSIPVESWNNYKAKTIRFAFCITQKASSTNTVLSYIKFIGNLIGSWRKALESEATYEYSAIDNLKVKFLKGGNYKVNYLDSISSSN